MKDDPGFAPAKVNLTLHVTGRRDDGYHLLDSLVAFADVGDLVRVHPAPAVSLRVDGPLAAGVPVDGSNLVLKAALALASGGQGAAITLEKHLPAAAGIGGGSSDAAAALRVLAEHWNCALPDAEAILALGADVPVCMDPRAARMSGIGELVQAVPRLPDVPVVLANPRVDVPTPHVFKMLTSRDNPAMPDDVPAFRDVGVLAKWVGVQRNDLEQAAIGLQPAIGDVLAALSSAPGALLARMSGSGATCFAIHHSAEAAERAARILAEARPEWWVTHAMLR